MQPPDFSRPPSPCLRRPIAGPSQDRGAGPGRLVPPTPGPGFGVVLVVRFASPGLWPQKGMPPRQYAPIWAASCTRLWGVRRGASCWGLPCPQRHRGFLSPAALPRGACPPDPLATSRGNCSGAPAPSLMTAACRLPRPEAKRTTRTTPSNWLRLRRRPVVRCTCNLHVHRTGRVERPQAFPAAGGDPPPGPPSSLAFVVC
jgi:hypothetical protein